MGRALMPDLTDQERVELFGDLVALLEFYETMGLEGMAVDLPEVSAGTSPRPVPGVRKERPTAVPSPKKSPSTGDKEALLLRLREEMGDCARCPLSGQRKNIVFGEGNPEARLMFIGEAPGREEDLQGRPFVGDAGMVLTNLIEKMGLRREDVYIANIIKCRPPMNRDPEPGEVGSCRSFVERQIEIIRPEVIMTLGRIALQTLFDDPKIKITASRGHFRSYKNIPVMPTFHPAYLMRNPKDKWLTWADAQQVMKKLGLD
jgi:DNA polymerase